MILYEYEGKNLLFKANLNVPIQQLINSADEEIIIPPPLLLKAQILSGNRAQNGGIILVQDKSELSPKIKDLFEKNINNEKVNKVLVEEKVPFKKEFYLSISYDTNERSPVLSISDSGGTGIEQRGFVKSSINILNPKANLASSDTFEVEHSLIEKLIEIFFENDCLLLEINPLVKTEDNRWVALDAKIKLDDSALGRHKDWNYPPRSAPGHLPTKNETEAKKIDESDYRGVAGSTYFDLEGDIAVLASGGGASLTAMDALLKAGGKPANYTEYSGNPPKEKVLKLAQIVLSKPNLYGLWIVGAIANFTDIYETLSGIVEALRQITPKPAYPIVIRRGGPRDKEAFEMLKQIKEFDLHLYGEETSITQSAEIMVKLAKEYEPSTT